MPLVSKRITVDGNAVKEPKNLIVPIGTPISYVLNQVNFEIQPGMKVGIVGRSGSGKSTLCKIISGYITHYTGEVTLDGKKIPDKDFYPVQLIFQHPEKTMNPKWKMEKVLNESWPVSQDLKDTFGLKDTWLTRWPSELSGGELQRFSILRALNPKTRFIVHVLCVLLKLVIRANADN